MLWHPSHVGAIWAASASEVMLRGLVLGCTLAHLVAADAVSEDGPGARARPVGAPDSRCVARHQLRLHANQFRTL